MQLTKLRFERLQLCLPQHLRFVDQRRMEWNDGDQNKRAGGDNV